MRDYLELLRRRPAFRTMWTAELVSLFGDWFTVVAVSLLTLGNGEHVVLLALSFVAHTLPQALLAPIAGPLADFVDRRRSLLLTAWAECALTVVMVLAALSSYVTLIPVLVLVRSVLGAMREPAASAALPRLVAEDEVVRANALLSMSWSVMFALGMATGGLVAGYRPDVALAIDAVSFAVAALLLMRLPAIEPEEPQSGKPGGKSRLAIGPLLAGMWDAVRKMIRDPGLRRAVLGKAPIAMAGGGGFILLNLTTHAHPFLGTAGVTLGVLQGLRGISTGVGPVLTERVLRNGARVRLVELVVVALTFAGIGVFIYADAPWALALSAVVWGGGAGANWVVTTSEMQRRAPRGFVGRLSAIDGLVWSVGMCAAAFITAVFAERTGEAKLAAAAILAVGICLAVVLEVTSYIGARRLVAVAA